MNISKPNTPMQNRGGYFYPLTSGDQVIVDDSNKLSKDNRFNIDLIYPIGSIYMSVNNTNPSILFGGEWTLIQDRFLVGAGNSYQTESTGGEATHTLTIAEMPNHAHRVTSRMRADGTNNGTVFAIGSSWPDFRDGIRNYILPSNELKDIPFESDYSVGTFQVGGSQPHNNLPPYYAVYIWQRTH